MILTAIFVLAGILGAVARVKIGDQKTLSRRTVVDVMFGAGLGFLLPLALPYVVVPLATLLVPGVALTSEQFRGASVEVKVVLVFFISYAGSHWLAAQIHKRTAVNGNGHEPAKETP